MKVFIDGQELPEAASAPEALQAAQEHVARSGRVLTEIQLDGMPMDEEAFLKVHTGAQACFSSKPLRVLINETLAEAQSYIPRLTLGLEEIATLFEGQEAAAAQGKLADALDGLDWLLLVYQKCCALLAAPPSEVERKRLEETLLTDISRLADPLEGKRFFEVALCIRKGLLPSIEEFSKMFQKLAAEAETPLQ
ncbi:MAG: hypothetical protein GX256_07610 [Fretibacterium sp.]|nr:hypothetical protein [Fretibacterium sp.]